MADLPLLGRFFLILMVWYFPIYVRRNIFPNLRASDSAIDVDEGMNFGPAAASPSGVAHRAIDTDLSLAELFGVEIGEILGSGYEIRRYGRPEEFYCPIQGWTRNRGQGSAWTSKDTLRVHLDMHLLGELQSRSSDEFLQGMGLRCCRVCDRNISQRYISELHPTY